MTDPVEIKIRAAVHAVEPAPEFTEGLWQQIQKNSRPAPASKFSFRWLWVPASAALLIGLVLVLTAPQTVMAAFRNFIAYLPGIGFIQNDAGTLYLPQPITVEQDGATLTLEQVVAGADNTVISYRVERAPGAAEPQLCFYDENQLLLESGVRLRPTGGGVSGSQARVEFLPLPAGVTRASLHISMNFSDSPCLGPQAWDLEFALGPLPAGVQLKPVAESQPAPAEAAPSVDSPVRFFIDQTALLDDGYVVRGHVTWTDPTWQNAVIDMESVSALDGQGKPVPVEPSEEGQTDNEFAFKIAGKDYAAPVTVRIQKLWVWANEENAPAVSFDAGSNPQVGQKWDLDQELVYAGQKIRILNVSVVQDTTQGQMDPVQGYAVEIDSAESVNGWLACSKAGENSNSWGQSRKSEAGHPVLESYYPDGLPTGQVSCGFRGLQFSLPGAWQMEWQPPAEIK